MTALKARLSAYLRKVKAGEEVHVYEHDHLVARLVPAERRAELVAIAKPARGSPRSWANLQWPQVLPRSDALERFLEERHREGRP